MLTLAFLLLGGSLTQAQAQLFNDESNHVNVQEITEDDKIIEPLPEKSKTFRAICAHFSFAKIADMSKR